MPMLKINTGNAQFVKKKHTIKGAGRSNHCVFKI